MILTRPELLKRIKSKEIIITPFSKQNVSPGAYEVTLSDEFRIYENNVKIIDLAKTTDYKKFTKLIKVKRITLRPHEFVLGITKEKIKFPSNMCGHITGRSRYARFGISVHISADFIQPGANNRQVLEIYNASDRTIVLHAGTKLAQIVFEECLGNVVYKGRHKSQKL